MTFKNIKRRHRETGRKPIMEEEILEMVEENPETSVRLIRAKPQFPKV